VTSFAGRRLAPFLAAAVALALAACGTSAAGGRPGPSSDDHVSGQITVFAAASLTESFTTLGKQFEAAHPGTTVTFSFGPSSGLAEQIDQGAPADAFASASTTTMDQVVRAGKAVHPTAFAGNVMEIAVPADNPAHVTRLADLASPAVQVALCQPQVPCGSVAAKVIENAGITVAPITLETDVKSVLAKVSLGEVDAGLVYVTDVRAAGHKVMGIAVPPKVNASTQYPIAALTGAPHPVAAAAFVDYVLSDAGRTVLTEAGFTAP
jgi:molybdate transport system substrate-binding protein